MRKAWSWVGLWGMAASALVWLQIGREALDWWRDGRLPAEPDESLPTQPLAIAAMSLAVLLPVCTVAAAWAWARRPRALPMTLTMGAVLQGVSAWAWTQVDDHGPLWPVSALGLAVAALIGAGTARSDWEPVAAPGRVPALASAVPVAVTGAGLVVLGWRGLDYQDFVLSWGESAPMWLALGLGSVMIVAAVVGVVATEPPRWWGRAVGLLLAGLGALALLFAMTWALAVGEIAHHEESETSWSYLFPGVAAGTGLLAAAIAAWRGRWFLVSISLSVGTLWAVVAISLDSSLGGFL